MDELRDRLQAALRDALKDRDRVAARAIRTALAAIANAEAVDPADHSTAEVPRRELGADDLRSIVGAEVSERRRAALTYEQSGRTEHAGELHREADVLDRILTG
ncbi:GatB/YqeY domain-containing protein [Microlunatus parietis]|uniref:GatB/YqeY domain-containing protein n=1 Tax=Microlunatus parietis TaxID=682979 RepID=A0A7Y9IE32_9ACTN|nr:GatB/YqeY domain-containing protein [Microlunatus parietis]NYE74539.1 hypothetical protein [Microlunatus parietis]